MKNIYYYPRLIWVKAMRLGYLSGCHQLPDRSFYIGRYQFPVCARCTGVLIGEAAALTAYLRGIKTSHLTNAAFAAVMFVDWFLQYIEIKESNNRRRFITGILGGYGCWAEEIGLVNKMLSTIKNTACKKAA